MIKREELDRVVALANADPASLAGIERQRAYLARVLYLAPRRCPNGLDCEATPTLVEAAPESWSIDRDDRRYEYACPVCGVPLRDDLSFDGVPFWSVDRSNNEERLRIWRDARDIARWNAANAKERTTRRRTN